MTLTLLIDLDDTLLSNNIDTFLPVYLKTLSKHMVDHVAPDRMVQSFLAATQVMSANNQAGLSLEKSFDQAFYPAIGKTKEELRPMLEQFYDNIFPNLQTLTSPRPAAIKMVEEALRQGHTLVVATNPLFPRKAIQHRLRWAGLGPEQITFSLITTYERFHFAKPNPAYFAEILAQLGWPNQPAVVIGNSLEDDLTPAATLGLPVFWVREPGDANDHLAPAAFPVWFHPLSDSGPIKAVPAWLKQIDSAGLRQEINTPAGMLAVLELTPAALDSISLDLTPRQWQERPAPDEWSLVEILCHMRDVDLEVNLPRTEKVLGEEKPFLPGVNADTWAEQRQYLREDGPSALRGLIEARGRLVERLENLTSESWQRPAQHAIFGPTYLEELVSFIVTHDRSHIQQALATIRALA